MTTTPTVLLVTIAPGDGISDESLDAIRRLNDGESFDTPATLTFSNEKQLGDVFNERTYTLLRTIREDDPESIRETARMVGRDVKNVHQELTRLEALGVIRFDETGRSKRPVFPYDDLVISPFAHDSDDSAAAAP